MSKTDQSNESETDTETEDLGFTFFATKAGAVFIKHNGRQVTELRGKDTAAFLKQTSDVSFKKQQQIMARKTGNYKRGNEKLATKHGRNR
jgi:hypothetical protein